MSEVNTTGQALTTGAKPDYPGLVRFLMEPFLDSPQSLKIDSEISHGRSRVLIRLAIEGEDKGRVFGRGGRNIQAVRTVLQAIAQLNDCSLHIEVFGGQHSGRDSRPERHHDDRRRPSRGSRPSRPHSS